MKGVKLVLAAATALCTLSIGYATAQAQATTRLPVVRVGEHVYYEDELLGTTREQLRTEYDAEIQGMSDEQLLKQFAVMGGLPVGKKPPQARDALAVAVFERAYWQFCSRAIDDVVFSRVYDSISWWHGLVESRYYDLPSLRETISRDNAYFDFMSAHRNDSEDKYAATYRKAVAEYGIDKPYEEWLAFARAAKDKPAFRRWSTRRYATVPGSVNLRMKSVLAHEVLSSACAPEGRFFKDAIMEWEWNNSVYRIVTIVNYQGDASALRELAATFCDQDGLVVPGGVAAMRDWFNALSPSARVEQSESLGILMKIPPPRPSKGLVQETPTQYRIVGYKEKLTLDQATIVNMQPALRLRAYALATVVYVPKIEIMMKELNYDLNNRLTYLADAAQFSAKPTPYVKEVYPASMFGDHDEEVDTAIVTAARLYVMKDQEGAKTYIEQLLTATEEATERTTKIALLRVAEKLCRDAKIEALTKKVADNLLSVSKIPPSAMDYPPVR